ncbi:MarR family transcriptional regulator [Rhodospirillum rubrum F11]|uniref:Transcriptional regulator, MarR family n=2 Tax=Rhodospirillum rubrum TaxID=1085 RepID=Q2RVR6_RHORT|nr:transcriptional regulator, MarR family [Rhodospirillum rubrum ATCC 11170]AEO47479.1 MarR family transcriptional regulator [Rhodospirillum rubrum F11]MBK5953337.1 MarR family transcriptional regulator [Rhodospirillum rubrum]QXG81443.1 MarR family winged helix-turn-helix transcriptional regulator [Rhodospirillum rubrum]
MWPPFMALPTAVIPRPIPIDYVTFRLDVIVSLAKGDASAVYEQACGLSIRDLRFLRIAAFDPGLPQGRLVAESYVEKTLVSKTISDLVRRGLLRREIDSQDARRVRLFVTAAGQAGVDACEILGRRLEAELMAGIGAEERLIFDRCIDTMMTNVEAMVARRPQGGGAKP